MMHLSDDLNQIIEKLGLDQANIERDAGRLVYFFETLLMTGQLSAQDSNILERFSEEFKSYEHQVQPTFKRSALHSQLQSQPLYTTLLLLPFSANEQSTEHEDFLVVNGFLAHLYLCRGAFDYPTYLQFYNTLLKPTSTLKKFGHWLSLDFIYSVTSDDIQYQLLNIAKRLKSDELATLARYFQSPRQLEPQITQRSITNAANQHETLLFTTDSHQVSFVKASNEFGEATGSYLKSTPNMQQSEQQERLSYRKQQAGLNMALYRSEVPMPWGGNLHPTEVGTFLDSINQGILESDFSEVSPQEIVCLLYFFLRTLGISDVDNILIINKGSKDNINHPQVPHSIEYWILPKKNHLSARLVLNAKLIKTSAPVDTDTRLHYTANEVFNYTLGFPIDRLLFLALRNLSTERRKRNLFSFVFNIDTKNYRGWANKYVQRSGIRRTGHTLSNIERTFHNFATSSVPEVYLNLLSQRDTVQTHYIASERSDIREKLDANWRSYIKRVGFTQTYSDLGAGDKFHHDEIGSPLTIRDEVLHHLIIKLSDCSSSKTLVSRINRCAFYIYLRSAVTLALRPVNEPLPESVHFDHHNALLSVSDKRSHHKLERRLLISSRSLVRLFDAFQSASQTLSVHFNISRPSILLAYLDETEKCWQPLSRSLVNQQLKAMTSHEIINHSFRHSAARHFLLAQLNDGTFNQATLNLFMNHSRSGVSLLNERSLQSIKKIATSQRLCIEKIESKYEHSDARIISALEALNSEIRSCS